MTATLIAPEDHGRAHAHRLHQARSYHGLPLVDHFPWLEFDQQTQQLFENKSQDDYQELIGFYWRWKQLILEAAAYKLNNASYKCQGGYQLGLKWDEFVNHSTDDDPRMLMAYTKGLLKRRLC